VEIIPLSLWPIKHIFNAYFSYIKNEKSAVIVDTLYTSNSYTTRCSALVF